MTAMPQRDSGSGYEYDVTVLEDASGQTYPATGSNTKVVISNPYTNYKPWALAGDTGYCLPSEMHSPHGAYVNAMEDIYCNTQEEYTNVTPSSANAADASACYDHIEDHHRDRSHGPKPYQALEPKRPSIVNKHRKSLMPI